MKSNQRKTKKATELRSLIEGILGVNVRDDKSRRREVVNARLIYSNILREEGFKCVEVGRFLRKDHTTVLHYWKTFDAVVETDVIVRLNYEKIKEMYDNDIEDIHSLSTGQLKKEVYTLRNELKKVNSENRKLTSKLTERRETQERLKQIMSLVKERTRVGSEEQVYKKLLTLFNGVYDY